MLLTLRSLETDDPFVFAQSLARWATDIVDIMSTDIVDIKYIIYNDTQDTWLNWYLPMTRPYI